MTLLQPSEVSMLILDILNLTGFSNQTIHMMKRLNRFKIQLRDLGTIHQLRIDPLAIL